MAIEADIEWDVEENCVYFVLVILGEFDPVLTLLRGEIGGVDIIHGTLRDQAGFQHGAQVGEDEILKTLLAHVIEKQRADHVAGERDDVMALEPGTLARTGESDCEYDNAFRRTRRRGRNYWSFGRCGFENGRRGLRRDLGLSCFRKFVGFFCFCADFLFCWFEWNRRGRSFHCGGSESLRDGLFAATATASTTATTAATANRR